jgi:hypothetical protein
LRVICTPVEVSLEILAVNAADSTDDAFAAFNLVFTPAIFGLF